jgi:hypothetical protein
MPRNIEIQNDMFYSLLWSDEARTDVVCHVRRKRMYDKGPEWTAIGRDGEIIRTFRSTQLLINWLINVMHARVDFRPIDDNICAMVELAKN